MNGPSRSATPRDFDAIARLSASFAGRGDDVDSRDLRTEFNRVVDDCGCQLVVVEDSDQAVVGYALAAIHPSFIARRPIVWVEELFVDPGQRSRGYGGALMAALHRWANEIGASHLALATKAAGGYYEALGYSAQATYYKRYLSTGDGDGP